MIQTLAYEHLKLQSPSKMTLEDPGLPDVSTVNFPTITCPKDIWIRLTNDYKVMGELVGLVVGNDNFSSEDILRAYTKLEQNICPTCDHKLMGNERIWKLQVNPQRTFKHGSKYS